MDIGAIEDCSPRAPETPAAENGGAGLGGGSAKIWALDENGWPIDEDGYQIDGYLWTRRGTMQNWWGGGHQVPGSCGESQLPIGR